MATEICIKTRTGMHCSASPIADCGCKPATGFTDPYREIDDDPKVGDRAEVADAAFERLSPKDKLAKRLNRVIGSASVTDGVADERGKDIVRIVKLLLLGAVDLKDSYVITALVDNRESR